MLKSILFINLLCFNVKGNTNNNSPVKSKTQMQNPSIPFNKDSYIFSSTFKGQFLSFENLSNVFKMNVNFNSNVVLDIWQIFLFFNLQRRILLLEILKKNPSLSKNFDSWDLLNALIILSVNLVFNDFFISSLPAEEQKIIKSNLEKILSKQLQNTDKNFIKGSLDNIFNVLIKHISNMKITKNGKPLNVDLIFKTPELLNLLISICSYIFELQNTFYIMTFFAAPEELLVKLMTQASQKSESNGKVKDNKSPSKNEMLDEDEEEPTDF
jgi:hypothetical protein